MKKVLCILVAVLMASMLFANGNAESSKKLTVWYEKSFSDEANALIEQRFEAFGKEKGVEVEYEMINAIDLMTKLNAAIEAGNAPDLVTLNMYKVLSYGENNPFLDVTDLMNEIDADRAVIKASKDATKIDGKNYFIPFSNSNTLLFLRKDVFEKKGVAIPTTWDELLEAAKKVADPQNGFYGFGMGCGPTDEDGENTFRMINWSNGGALYTKDGEIIADSDPITLEMVTKYKELYEAGAIPPASSTWGPSGNNGSYLMGESAMVFNAATLYNALKNDPNYAELFANTIVLPPPVGRSGSSVNLNLASGFGINASSSNIETAKEFIKYILDDSWYNDYFQAVAPVFTPVFQDQKSNPLYADSAYKAAFEYAENATGYYGYPVDTLDGRILASKHYYQFPVCQLLNNVVAKGMTPKAALSELAKATQDVKNSL